MSMSLDCFFFKSTERYHKYHLSIFVENYTNERHLQERVILAVANDIVDEINKYIAS